MDEKDANVFDSLLSEINYHRNNELQSHFDNSDPFVVLNPIKFWIDLFIRSFVCCDSISEDDLLMFVRKTPKKTGSKYVPKYETHIDVFRKNSKKLPIGETVIDWEETLYLNIIMQYFDYTITCAVCTRTSPKELQILSKHSQRVFASPSRRSMDSKGEIEEIVYPNIFFTVDNYEELLDKVKVRDGEIICVELMAKDKNGKNLSSIFLGSINYESLKRVYEARASISSKSVRKLGNYSNQQRFEFVKMRGPNGKGYAEIAVTKEKGSNVETPSAEPGYSLADFEWETEMENQYNQRRMSDPSSNLTNCIRGWQTKRLNKSRSENEGVNRHSNGLSEIEAVDVRDELGDPAYNKLWAMRGFNQAYYSWKESRRANSMSLNSYLTYLTLPWHHIIADLLNCRHQPILTF